MDTATPSTQQAAPTVNAQISPELVAETNWLRYEYGKSRGHTRYVQRAQRCENFYFGGDTTDPRGYDGNGQWSLEDADKLREEGRPSYTINEIKSGVDSAIGYQIHNRMDISYRPAGGLADQDKATIRSKLAMHVLSRNKFHWLETQVCSDGMIEQRGYFEIRMDFTRNIYGEIKITELDPRDVIPDPDSKTYDPDGWYDVTTTRWLSADQIEENYGKEARRKAERFVDSDGDFGELDDSGFRNKFGDQMTRTQLIDAYRMGDDGVLRYRIVDRQRWVYQLTTCAVYDTGDVEPLAEGASAEQIAGYVQAGAVIMKRMYRRVHWTITTRWSVIYDGISPYDRFTTIPYFCYFRRGRTQGKVDNAIDPQQIANKSVSSIVHILNTSANSGWISEYGTIVNMTNDELETKGSKTGLNLVVKAGTPEGRWPQKIKPNDIPQGMERVLGIAQMGVKSATVPDAMRGTQSQEISGVAIQSRQFASQQELALPLDNLNHTRELVADFVSYLLDTFYDNYRVFRITEKDPRTGKDVDVTYEINKWDELKGVFLNDMTEGKYDTVVDSVPMQVTFENSQFMQALEMKGKGVNIPDTIIVKNSNLADKAAIIDQMENQGPTAEQLLAQSKQTLAVAQAALARANAANIRMTTLFAGVQAGNLLANNPAIGPIADSLAGSAGLEDQDAPPAVPTPAAGTPALPVPRDTSPLTPAGPAMFPAASANQQARRGMEGGRST